MAKYKVITRCHGFRRRIWEVGTIVDIAPGENPPRHFVKIDDNSVPVPVPVVSDKHSLSEIRKPPEVVGGMGSSFIKPEIPQARRSNAKK